LVCIPFFNVLARCNIDLIPTRFPRLLKKGTQQELQVLAAERAERDRYLQQRRAEEGKVVQETQVTSAPQDVPQAPQDVPQAPQHVPQAPQHVPQAA
jgi:hypothetical protein